MIEGLSCIISRLRSLRTKPYPPTSILQLCCVENHRFSHRCNRQAKQNLLVTVMLWLGRLDSRDSLPPII